MPAFPPYRRPPAHFPKVRVGPRSEVVNRLEIVGFTGAVLGTPRTTNGASVRPGTGTMTQTHCTHL